MAEEVIILDSDDESNNGKDKIDKGTSCQIIKSVKMLSVSENMLDFVCFFP